jgi:hypothetical protein
MAANKLAVPLHTNGIPTLSKVATEFEGVPAQAVLYGPIGSIPRQNTMSESLMARAALAAATVTDLSKNKMSIAARCAWVLSRRIMLWMMPDPPDSLAAPVIVTRPHRESPDV